MPFPASHGNNFEPPWLPRTYKSVLMRISSDLYFFFSRYKKADFLLQNIIFNLSNCAQFSLCFINV